MSRDEGARATAPLRLNLGAGDVAIPGYTPVDRKTGGEAYPLAFDDNSVDEIRASHVLEHFPHTMTGAVLADWVRALKPGGKLSIAVPDFDWICRAYQAGAEMPVQWYVMGAQIDGDDRHGAIFDEECLSEAMRAAGLVFIRRWQSEVPDCASAPVSLNLCGRKPPVPVPTIGAAMSVPRLGFMDNFFCAMESLPPLRIGIRRGTGAYWGQCLERTFDSWLDAGVDYILAIDYDTVFTRQHVETLIGLALDHPEADAIAPLQAARHDPFPLLTVKGPDGKNVGELPEGFFSSPLAKVATAHFGLTLLKADAIRRLPRPLFIGQPDADGQWGEGRIDDDVYFWKQWEKHGNTLFVAHEVAVGHLEMMIRWPGQDLRAIHQHPNDYRTDGMPKESWSWRPPTNRKQPAAKSSSSWPGTPTPSASESRRPARSGSSSSSTGSRSRSRRRKPRAAR